MLKEVGIQADKEQLKALMTALKGKKLHELIGAGMSKLQSVAAGKANERFLAPAAPAEKKEAPKKGKAEPKKEDKKEEEKKEDDTLAAGGLNIFGDEA